MNLRDARLSRESVGPRPSLEVITRDFATVWPDVARPLTAMLRRRGVSHHDAAEIVQETAARAFGRSVPYTDADDLFRWASVVSWRLAIDGRRRRARLSDAVLPDRADSVDVASIAEQRVVLGAVGQRLADLSDRDREVLLSSFDDGPVRTRLESVRLAVARHRARNRLRALLDGLAAPILGLWARRHRVLSAPAEAIAYAVTPAAACLLVGVMVVTGPSQDHVDAHSSPSPVRVEASVPTAPTASQTAAPVVTAPAPGTKRQEESPSPPKLVPEASVVVPTPNDNQAEATLRPKTESDELVCATTPPVLGETTICVEQPVKVGLSPP